MAASETQASLADTITNIVREQKPETLDHLANLVLAQNHSFTRKEILDTINTLIYQGKIKLTPTTNIAPTFSSYLKTTSATWFWGTIILTIGAITSIFTIPEGEYPIVIARYVFGAIFVLWLPGYTFIKALFPQSRLGKRDLDPIERIALSVGMSLALVPITGLLLNYTPWGIRLTPITLSLLVLTMAFATTALMREYKIQTQKAEP